MFDVFYFGPKPNRFAHEQPATSLEDAADKSRTGLYWYIYGGNDYSKFDFDFVPPPWESHQTHVWANQWQPNGEVYLANKHNTQLVYNYRTEQPVHRLPELICWSVPDYIDSDSVDQRWCPDPLDPPYIYHFASQHQSASGVTYTVAGATEHKLVDYFVVHTLSNEANWLVPDYIDTASVDYSWHPNPLDPPYIYHFASQWQSSSGVTYTVAGATEIKLTDSFAVRVLASETNWLVPDYVDQHSVDFTWRPNPLDPPYIYHFASQHQSASGVTYTVAGATEIKLTDSFAVRVLASETNWLVPGYVDSSSVDFTWRPNPLDPPYIYHFASQHQSASGVTYTVPGAAEIKLTDSFAVRVLANEANWYVPDYVDQHSVDFTWHPNPLDSPYIYHFASQWQSSSGVTYTVPGAAEIKLTESFVVCTLPNEPNWYVPDHINPNSVDFTWHPNPLDSPYIYHFASQHQSASGVTYTVPGAAEIKLVDQLTVLSISLPNKFRFNFAVQQFDYSWHPDALDPAMCYVFGNQWNPSTIEPTVIYNISNSTVIRYMEHPIATAAADISIWTVLDDIVDFDYSWRPDPTDPPYIYVFGNQWLSPELRPALEYTVAGATETKYMEYPRATRISQPNKFKILYNASFDFSWEPDPGDPAYIYVFGNQWHAAEVMPTVEYAVAGATERKFLDYPRAQLPEKHDNCWHTLTDCEWDYSWVPDPGDPPYIYVFGNQWHAAEVMPTVEYHMPGATDRKYLEYPQAQLLPMLDRWSIPEEINIDNINLTWHPHPADQFIHHFGSQYQKSTGLTYTTPGAKEIKLEDELPIKQKDQRTIAVLDIFFVDRGNSLSAVRFEQLQQRFSNVQKIRYANSMLETIRRCTNRSSTNKFWVISSENVYSEFDFAWHAEPWQSYMTHIFGSQWQKWSDTYLVNKWEFERHAKWATALEQFPSLNFVKNQTVHRPNDLHDIYYVDHNNSNHQLVWMQQRYPNIKVTRFVDNYLDTFKRIMTTATTEYVWITSSICSYAKFDFSWQPEPWQKEMIHVFGSSSQRRGDTFYIHVESFKRQMYELEMLDWFNVINYCQEQLVDRLPAPVVLYTEDSIVPAVQAHQFDFPYTVFTDQSTLPDGAHDPCLWHAKDRVVAAITRSGATTIVPREIKAHLHTQMYDYPYVNRKGSWFLTEKALDIVFISNGEPDEELMYHHTKYMTNRAVKWIRGINGRVAAYQAAARASTTPWFFAVFAKLEVAGAVFPWHDWQPDYWQEPKHYIFNARNPVNALEYGHQGMIAYNKQLVLENNNPGIDFTLSQAHESVPLLSGVAKFNQDPWMTWRTAFREVVKLKHFMSVQPTVETEHRLNVWLTVAQGDHATWCLRGAADAVDYYTEVGGDYNLLMLSFDWAWLQTRFIQCSNS